MSGADNVRLLQTVAEAVAEGGPLVTIEHFDEWYSEDFEWHPISVGALDGRAYRGKEEFEAFWEEFLEIFGDVRYSFSGFEAVDDSRVFASGEIHATGASSGAPIDREFAYVFEVENGRVTRGRSFFTPDEAREFLDA